MKIAFLSPILGITIFLISLIGFLAFFYTKNFYKKVAFFEDLEKIFWKTKHIFYINCVLILLILSIYSLIFSTPVKQFSTQKDKKNGIDIVFLFDVSISMNSKDILPTRLDLAKEVVEDFIWELKNDRVWLVYYSGLPFLWSSLVFDYDFVKQKVQNLSVNTINQNYSHLQWSAIWNAMLYWSELFDEKDLRKKTIVIFTDWESKQWINYKEAIDYLKQKNVIVYTVWIWWYQKTFAEFNWNKLDIQPINEDVLKEIASSLNWKYYRASDELTFKNLFKELNLLEKKELEVEKIVTNKPFTKELQMALLVVFAVFLFNNFYFYIRN